MIINNQIAGRPSQQQGVALFMGLIFLILMSLVALASSRGSILQERMTSAVKEQNEAFQAAEDIVRQAELDIRNAALSGTVALSTQVTWADIGLERTDCAADAVSKVAAQGGANWTDASDSTAFATDNDDPSREARYVVIKLDPVRLPGSPKAQSMGCATADAEASGGTRKTQKFLIVGYAESPARTMDATVVSNYVIYGD